MESFAALHGSGEKRGGAIDDVVVLIRYALNGGVPDAERVARMDLDAVYEIASNHMIAAACFSALEAAGVEAPKFEQAFARAVMNNTYMNMTRSDLFARLDTAGIWHVALKGSVLQGIYPSGVVREMCDNDILYDASRADEVRVIMEDMGFTCHRFGVLADDKYQKPPVLNFEMHRRLFSEAAPPNLYGYYRDVERLLVPDGDGTCGRHFSDEEFYVYMNAHEWKHYRNGGSGIRSLMDMYVWLRDKADSMDWDLVRAKLDDLGIAEFEERNRELATHLLGGEDLTADDELMLRYMVDSGTYGTVEHRVVNLVWENGRLGYVRMNVFPPLRSMRALFPVLNRAPILLPACWLARFAIVIAKKPGRILHFINEQKVYRQVSKGRATDSE